MENKIKIEILEIAPTLASLEKRNPFSIPKGYFPTLEQKVFDAIDKKQILANSTPSGYFENLSDKVLDKIHAEEKVKIIPLYKRRWLSIAASFILLLGAGYLINTQTDNQVESTEFVLDIEPGETLEYLIENDKIYLSDLLNFDITEEELSSEETSIMELYNEDLEDLLNELDESELEELL